mmetsp:Transcript_33537/g.73207  ORF Transcript_33537/g.73207 Transcript_33537/m.73207 type:complete len:104 (+) Transcript_33537:813-1124(+)|eukprot:CAMPEP_0116949226 /NCGR_PEP_ID=MMETSP0467-20121206/38767_1 /TAXON_ID=283647 /ORGANISM="Mesodinium pulex, Strain SPMC105" /LENGTH=103 /DNA_ID=CAMNT_0004633779 /DNA_START=806 /DNA_END=1117 /DNA_ORIENTATION=-
MTAFAISMLVSGKLSMEVIQNATLAGGVAIGACSDLVVGLWGALLIGCIGGAVSALGFGYGKKFMYEKIGLHDTCGVLWLHGLPGCLGGIVGAITSAIASENL